PGVGRAIANNSRRGRAQLKTMTVGIGLDHYLTAGAFAQLKFINLRGANIRNEQLPYTAVATTAHRVKAAVPAIEVAHHTNARSRRRPNGKEDTGNAIYSAAVRTHMLIYLPVSAFAKPIQVVIAKG